MSDRFNNSIPDDQIAELKSIADQFNKYDLNDLKFDKWNGQSLNYLVAAGKYIKQFNKWSEYNNVLKIMILTDKHFSENTLKHVFPGDYTFNQLRQLIAEGYTKDWSLYNPTFEWK